MRLRTLFVAASALALSGCLTQSMDDLNEYIAEVKARNPGPIEPIPEIKPVETFAYLPMDRRNPFVPEKPAEEEQAPEEALASGPRPDEMRPQEELEAYPLDSLRMMGMFKQGEMVTGLVRNAEGVIYPVKVGNYLGQNHGQITRIQEDRIELTEIVPDSRGGYRERQASLALVGGEQK